MFFPQIYGESRIGWKLCADFEQAPILSETNRMSELALQLIAENKRTRNPFLDLGKCGLTKMPAEVGELVWLEGLSLASEWYEWDGQKWQRKRSRNAGDSNRALTDLGPLASLPALRALDVSFTRVTDLA